MESNSIRQSNNMNIQGQNNYAPTDSSVQNSTPQNESLKFQTEPQHQPVNRLNALDSTLLENNAYKDMDDDAFKTEYRIGKLETELKLLDKQINAAKALNDQTKIDMLTIKKHSVENELQSLYSSYQGADISRKLTNGITSLVAPKKKKNIFEKAIDSTKDFLTDKVLSKISRRFSSGKDLKVAVNKLQNINSNVNELVSHQAPYGEAEEKYDQLTKYLTKANTIQYQVSRELSKEDSRIKGNPFADQISKEKSEALAKKKDKKDIAKKNALNLNNNLKG